MITFLLGVTTGVGLVLASMIIQSYWLDHRYRQAMRKRYR